MKILGLNIVGKGTIGNGLGSWSETDLSGNTPILLIKDVDPIPLGYSDISTIENWAKYGDGVSVEFGYYKTRKEIQKLLPTEALTGNTTGLTSSELAVVQEYKLDKYYAIYDYINTIPITYDVVEAPLDYNYNILNLHKKKYYDQGELINTEYYGVYDFPTDSYSKIILHEENKYYRVNEMVHKIETTICWHHNDGTTGTTKTLTKYFTQQESIRLGEERRRNVISNVKLGVLGLIMQTSGVTKPEAEALGFAFIQEYNEAINVYIEGALQFLYGAVLNDINHSWLNNEIPNTGGMTIRDWLYNEITLDYNVNNTYT